MMTMKELVAEYNKVTGKSVKRFSSIAAGKKALKAAVDAKPSGRKEHAAESWNDPLVAAKRSKRYAVKVINRGTTQTSHHDSVAKAFRALNLPMGVHIGFRQKLVAEGKQTIEHYTFAIDKGE